MKQPWVYMCSPSRSPLPPPSPAAPPRFSNPMDRGAWWATVHRVAKSQTQLKRLSTRNMITALPTHTQGFCLNETGS